MRNRGDIDQLIYDAKWIVKEQLGFLNHKESTETTEHRLEGWMHDHRVSPYDMIRMICVLIEEEGQ